MNEFVSAKKRGRFFLLYEVLFLFGLLSAGLIGYFLVPIYGWQAMFVVGLAPAVLTIPMRWLMVESPAVAAFRRQDSTGERHRKAHGRRPGSARPHAEAPTAVARPLETAKSDIRELFKGIYFRPDDDARRAVVLLVHDRKRAHHLAATLYRQVFQLPLANKSRSTALRRAP